MKSFVYKEENEHFIIYAITEHCARDFIYIVLNFYING